MLHSSAETLEALIKLLRCSRRSTPESGKDVTAQKQGDDLLAELSTDLPDDTSNPSGQEDYSTDEADVAAMIRMATPPGLTLSDDDGARGLSQQKQASWNPSAQPFFPGGDMQHRANAGTNGFSAASRGGGFAQQSPESDNLMALKQALDRLAPGEIATVKSMLDGKMRDNPSTSLPTGGYQSSSRFDDVRSPAMQFSGSRLSQARRPFAPFGSTLHPKPRRMPESSGKL
jgi:hypothetical protein